MTRRYDDHMRENGVSIDRATEADGEAMVYLYRSHMGSVYTSDKQLPFSDLYCEQCGDSDDDYGWVDENDLSQLVDAASCLGFHSPISMLCTPYGLAEVARDYTDETDGDWAEDQHECDDSILTEYASDTAYDLFQVLKAVDYKGIDLSKPGKELIPGLEKIVLEQVKAMLADRGVYPLDEEKIYKGAVAEAKGKVAGEVLAMNLLGIYYDAGKNALSRVWEDTYEAYACTPEPWWSIVHRAYCENVDGYKEAWDHLTAADGKHHVRVDKYAPEWAQVLQRDLPGLDGKIFEYVIKDPNVGGVTLEA